MSFDHDVARWVFVIVGIIVLVVLKMIRAD